MPLLIQVDLGHEETKSGIEEQELPRLAEKCATTRTPELDRPDDVAAFFDDPEQARPFFRRLRELRDELASQGAFGDAQRASFRWA